MEENQEKRKRNLKIPSPNSLRNLGQFKSMSDEEFKEYYDKVVLGVDKDDLIKERFDRLMNQFNDEYDLSEMLPNDRMVLSGLVSAMIQLEDYESDLRALRKDSGINQNNISMVQRLGDACSLLRRDISSMQGDLKITRKARKSEQEQSVLTFVESLKEKAKQFAHLKMRYIYCERCGQLLATVWFQTDAKGNELRVICKRKLENDQPCGWTRRFTASELIEMQSTNRPEIMPDAMK